jgi:hypothetical protein
MPRDWFQGTAVDRNFDTIIQCLNPATGACSFVMAFVVKMIASPLTSAAVLAETRQRNGPAEFLKL